MNGECWGCLRGVRDWAGQSGAVYTAKLCLPFVCHFGGSGHRRTDILARVASLDSFRLLSVAVVISWGVLRLFLRSILHDCFVVKVVPLFRRSLGFRATFAHLRLSAAATRDSLTEIEAGSPARGRHEDPNVTGLGRKYDSLQLARNLRLSWQVAGTFRRGVVEKIKQENVQLEINGLK